MNSASEITGFFLIALIFQKKKKTFLGFLKLKKKKLKL